MATSGLTAAPKPADTFRHFILTNLEYWQDYVAAAKPTDTATLDRGRNRILKALTFAFKLQEAWPLVSELIEAFSPYMERRGYWEAWNWILTQAIEMAHRTKDMAGEVLLSALFARLLQQQSHLPQAITYHRQTIRLACRVGDRYNEARACSNLGYLYAEQGYAWRAEVLCCHALVIFEQLDDNHGRAHTENHLGVLYIQQHRWIEAEERLKKACTIWQAMGDRHGLMRGFINLSSLYLEMERPLLSLPCLGEALRLAKVTGEEVETGKIYMNMGVAHRQNGDYDQAEAYARQAEAIFQRFSSSVSLAQVWANLGAACLAQNKRPEARNHYQAALQVWRNLKDENGQIKALLGLVDCELAGGNWAEALDNFKELECLINRRQHVRENDQQLFVKYRRSLSEYLTR
jgi:tetratricopeptide (TPR) repeat protein